MKSNSFYLEWIQKADNDLLTARILLKEAGPTDTLCFHCHQAVEKYLKAFLTYYQIDFRKMHDLSILGKLASKKERKFLDFLKELKALNAYYIESRYPPDIAIYSLKEAKETLKIATEVIDFIKNALKNKE